MMQFKLDSGCLYTDTDSIFTSNKLPDNLINDEIGSMKDELSGKTIDKAYFLGIKKYGYKIGDQEKSTIKAKPRGLNLRFILVIKIS
jgi:hypothetical protein